MPKYAFQVARVAKNLPANARDLGDKGLIPGSGRSPGGGHGNSLHCSCLEKPMDRGAWRAVVLWGCTESDSSSDYSWQHGMAHLNTIYWRYIDICIHIYKIFGQW